MPSRRAIGFVSDGTVDEAAVDAGGTRGVRVPDDIFGIVVEVELVVGIFLKAESRACRKSPRLNPLSAVVGGREVSPVAAREEPQPSPST